MNDVQRPVSAWRAGTSLLCWTCNGAEVCEVGFMPMCHGVMAPMVGDNYLDRRVKIVDIDHSQVAGPRAMSQRGILDVKSGRSIELHINSFPQNSGC